MYGLSIVVPFGNCVRYVPPAQYRYGILVVLMPHHTQDLSYTIRPQDDNDPRLQAPGVADATESAMASTEGVGARRLVQRPRKRRVTVSNEAEKTVRPLTSVAADCVRYLLYFGNIFLHGDVERKAKELTSFLLCVYGIGLCRSVGAGVKTRS